jgi:hypothetical protein
MATARSSPTTVEEAIEVLFPGAINPREDTFLLLRLSPEMDRVIEELMKHSALAKEEVINMAVGFLKTAADAIDEGKRVGIAREDQELEVEFTGI